MLGGMAIALAGRSSANDTIAEITAAARAEHSDFTPDEEADAREADRQYGRLGGAAVIEHALQHLQPHRPVAPINSTRALARLPSAWPATGLYVSV